MGDGEPQWWNWCRLCAKQECENKFDILMDERCVTTGDCDYEELKQALDKYFCINPSSEGKMPFAMCGNCNTFLYSLIKFAEHVQRVQLMYAQLVEMDGFCDINVIRTRFQVLDDYRHHEHTPIPTTELSHIKYTVKEETVGINQMDYDEEPLECDVPEDGDDPFATMEDFNLCNIANHSQEEPSTTRRKLRTRNRKNQNEKFGQPSNKKSFDYDFDCPFKERKRRLNAYKPTNSFPADGKETTPSSKEMICKLNIQDEEKQQTDSDASDHSESLSEEEINIEKLIRRKRQKQRDINRKKKAEIPIDYTMDAACASCGEKFFLFSKYSDHMLTSHVNNQWKCITCNRALQSRYEFERHLRKHLPKNGIIKHICTICGLKLSCSTTLNRHLSVHSDKMQHLCEHCGRAFKRDTTLKAHMILHTGLKPYSCNFCQLSFACSSNCRRHMRKAHSEGFAALQTFGNKTQGNEAI